MMSQILLTYFSLKELLYLSSISKSINLLIDPNRYGVKANGKYLHLKRIAAINLLPNGEHLTLDEIDKAFGEDVKKIADYQKILKGQKIKRDFMNEMAQMPDLTRFGRLDNRNCGRIIETWQSIHGGSVFEMCS